MVAFTGHLVDHPAKPPEKRGRFPDEPALIDAVKAAVADRLAGLDASVGYSSGGNGSDLLFAEALLERGGELHVVLPFDCGEFIATSVDFGFDAMAEWRRRFERVLKRATVHQLSDVPYGGDDGLFAAANDAIQSLALERADREGRAAVALAVIDPASAGARGGAAEFLETWSRRGGRVERILLDELRRKSS